jgi:molybdate transport system permease protein
MTSVMSPDAWQAIALTLKLAAFTTIILLIVATPLAWWLSQTRSKWRAPISALVTLPLVLPPTVLGFYLLMLLGPQGWVGRLTEALGVGLLSFSFTGILLGSIVFSLPFRYSPFSMRSRRLGAARSMSQRHCVRAP